MAITRTTCLGCSSAIREARKHNPRWPEGEPRIIRPDVVENSYTDVIEQCIHLNERTKQCGITIVANGKTISVDAICDGPNQ